MSRKSELVTALEPVVEVFEQLGVAYLIGGSVASSMHGMGRSTMDIDLVADLEENQVAAVVSALEAEYHVNADVIRDAIRRRSSFNLIHEPTMFKVDVFLPKNRDYDREALARRVKARLEEDPGGREYFLATPEDTILAKLEWYDRGDRVSERQWGDILGVLQVQGDLLDQDYLRRWASKLAIEDLLERAFRGA